MLRPIRRVAVLGAGTMGSQIAAHLANARIPCVLLDRLPLSPTLEEERKEPALADPLVRDRLGRLGVEMALKSRPPAFFVPANASLITLGNFEDHLNLLKGCDWIIEAVTENLDVKRDLLKRVEPFISPGAIVSSNTSGISIEAIAQGFSFLPSWLGTHFFNPPRYMKLLEIIPIASTLPEVVERISWFGDEVLGKGIVVAKDRPNFIANRIGVFVHLATLEIMQEEGFSIEEVDALTGPVMGLPKSATFRTADLVGLDVMAHVVQHLYESLPGDERRADFRLPEFMERMIERGLLGQKTGQGFYKRIAGETGNRSEILTLDLGTFAYRPRQKPKLDGLEMVKSIGDTRQRARALFQAQGRVGHFYRQLLGRTFHYAASRIPEISDDLVSVDHAMQWGFNWECGVFELWDAIGVDTVAAHWREQRIAPPPLVEELLAAGKKSFYLESSGQKSVFDLRRADYVATPEKPGLLLLSSLRSSGREVKCNPGASLIDLGDGVLSLEFHSKMNILGPDTIQMIHFGLQALEESFEAMVIGNQGANFSAGANLLLLLLSIQEEEWDEVSHAVRAFQDANMALKYASRPVVAAPFGLTLGGGVETSLHCARRVAAAETYMGLVEAGVGLIPAGGGTKEMLVRALDSVPADDDADAFLPLKMVFKNIGMATVSTSAEEARNLGYLTPDDVICMNRDRQIALAKQMALELARLGYRPGKPRQDVPALGEPAFSKMKLALHLLRRGEYISNHDALIATKLAEVLSGGCEWKSPGRVSEQYLLDLEREAFLSLCGEKKTAERIQYMLKNGKPLRN
ncbi:MAG TPA: 3-hydroxyacyl-CoA dehydrogenase NAD-binding domain-containing protein [Terriglobia bacterium]|nr:3-hydroxyacyl-CoA dehydrogenase NAD-binding domain-containing protein [Terriglobia bacterium]